MGKQNDSVIELITALRALRRREAQYSEDVWWNMFLANAAQLCLARDAYVVDSAVYDRPVLRYAFNEADQGMSPQSQFDAVVNLETLCLLIHKAAASQFALSMPSRPGECILATVKLPYSPSCYLVLLIDEVSKARLREVLLRAELIADIPDTGVAPEDGVCSGTEKNIARNNAPDFPGHGSAGGLTVSSLTSLDLVVDIYRMTTFSSAAYALVNGLVTHCDTVDTAVLGWEKDGYVRVIAISHFDKFEKKTEYVKLLEAAMEEASDQGHAIGYVDNRVLPEGTLLSLAHQQLKVDIGCHAIVTLPLPKHGADEDDIVIMLVSQKDEIETTFIQSVNVLSYLVRPRLEELKYNSENFFLQQWRGVKRRLGQLLGPRRLWTKVITAVLSALLLFGIFGTLPHRIDASAQLTTENIRTVSAPFEGRIELADLTSGEVVEAQQRLAQMETVDLLLQRSEHQADLLRFQAEVNNARADMNQIEAEIGMARVAQSQARLDRINAHLLLATITSPIAGVVIEGERQELLGMPVNQGQSLYRIAYIDDMYLRIHISEEDIHFINSGDSGEFVFLSQPGEKQPFSISRIVPVARVEGSDGARFEVRGDFEVPAEPWWRPGMSGVVKVDQGRKQAAWVIMHKLINRLRLWFWW